MDDKTFEYHRDKVFSIEEKRINAIFSTYRNITTISAALLGLLIGLIPKSFDSSLLKEIYLSGLFLLVSCILFSLIVQSYEVFFLHQEAKFHLKKITDNTNLNTSKTTEVTRTKTGTPYYIFQVFTVLCFFGAIISFLIYVVQST